MFQPSRRGSYCSFSSLSIVAPSMPPAELLCLLFNPRAGSETWPNRGPRFDCPVVAKNYPAFDSRRGEGSVAARLRSKWGSIIRGRSASSAPLKRTNQSGSPG
jgi:hypothetical protein